MTDSTLHLSHDECWKLLAEHSVARLAVDVAGQPDIFPINYVVDGESIVFRSGAGTKLASAVIGRHVAVEIDGLGDINGLGNDDSVWSVVVKGIAHQIENMEERYAADDLPLYPWVVANAANFVRITPELVTGRQFHVIDGTRTESTGVS